MMVIFWANFAGGVVAAVAPLAYASAPFHVALAACLALAAGSFGGRALRVWGTRDFR